MIASVSEFVVTTRGQGMVEITDEIAARVKQAGLREGTASLLVRHTSASLLLFENADPTARADMEAFLERIAPENDPDHRHTAEGPDDMPAHIRMALTRSSEVIPVSGGRLLLGTWQGIFLCEHRRTPHRRTVALALLGE